MAWRRFLGFSLGGFLALFTVIYAFILVVDPYQDVPFSPDLPRAPIAQNQRYSYPAIARDAAFDSAIIGTSTLRLVDPALLDAPLGARFANLAMNSATAYEQHRMHALFVRQHPAAKYLVLGIDDSWCRRGEEAERATFRGFPEWMYDDNRWNDLLYLFNDKALENAVRMSQYMRGRREARYAANGYRDFTRAFGPFDLVRARRAIYGKAHEGVPPPIPGADLEPALRHPDWHLPNLAWLPELLARTPAGTRLLLVFPPFHVYHSQQEQALLSECKGRVIAAAAAYPRVVVADYMLDSPLTRDDSKYWDELHPVLGVAEMIGRDAVALLGGRAAPERAELRVRRLAAHAP